jgi:hypothetical protein
VKPKLARGGRGRSRFNFTRNSSDLGRESVVRGC